MRRTIKLKESELRRMISESVKRILNEIGDKNDFALDAVRGRRAAKQYYTNMNDTEKAENNRVMGLAQDKIYKNYSKNHNLGVGNGPGYYYGFKKGLDKYANGDISESLKRVLKENAFDYWTDSEDKYLTRERLPKGWEKIERDNDEPLYTDNDGNQYIKDEYGKFKILNESLEDWYAEEDYNGNTGQPGMVRSYDTGYQTLENAEVEAQEDGNESVEEYLKEWFNEVKYECPWTWVHEGFGYGYKGTTIFEDDGVICKEIYGQVFFDEYPPQSLNETILKKMITKSLRKTLNEAFDTPSFEGSKINGRSGLLHCDNGEEIVLYNIRFVGDSIVGTNRNTNEEMRLFISPAFGQPLNGSNIPFAREIGNGVIDIKNLTDINGNEYKLTVND